MILCTTAYSDIFLRRIRVELDWKVKRRCSGASCTWLTRLGYQRRSSKVCGLQAAAPELEFVHHYLSISLRPPPFRLRPYCVASSQAPFEFYTPAIDVAADLPVMHDPKVIALDRDISCKTRYCNQSASGVCAKLLTTNKRGRREGLTLTRRCLLRWLSAHTPSPLAWRFSSFDNREKR